MRMAKYRDVTFWSFSALQRAEIAEIANSRSAQVKMMSFSALQRAEIAEIAPAPAPD